MSATSSSSTGRTDHRPSRGARRFGYVVAVMVNAAMLYGVNRWPGWDAVPFLTADTVDVLDLVNASIVVNLVANVIFLWRDPPRLKAAGDLVSTSVGLVAILAIWQVFPLDLSSGMERVARVLLGIALVGTAIGILVAFRRLVLPDRPDRAVHGTTVGTDARDQGPS